jgi:glutaminyl-peptide cyclotransferase
MRHTHKLVAGVILTILAGCQILTTPSPTVTPTATATATSTPFPTSIATATQSAEIERLRPEVIATYPHDNSAYTEGLVYDRGLLYESTGSYPESTLSTLREVELETGQVLRSLNLQPEYYGEGLALVNGQLIQLTWKGQIAFVYDRSTFQAAGQLTYNGEGWGLCFDGTHLYMSDGSSTITVRDPASFNPVSTIEVRQEGQPVLEINELECVGEEIYANVWHSENILRINKRTGRVNGVIDASGLRTTDEIAAAGPEDVLNGIAYNPDTDTFYITGKRWAKLYEVRFVQATP